MHVGIVGAGYVGLVTGVCLAEMGNDVLVADIDERKIAALAAGRSPHYEPGLEQLLQANVRAGRLRWSARTADAARDARVVFLAVGTPQDDTGAANLSHMESAVRALAPALAGPCVFVVKSTVPVGTGRRLARLAAPLAAHPIAWASNPEFLKEGAAVADFMRPDRVVVGSDDPGATALLLDLYAPFVRTGAPILTMDVESAEMTKYAANTLLAARISLMNEIAGICRRAGADVEKVRQGVGTDRRIGPTFLFAGLGYGGSCFPKDVRALASTAEALGASAPICRAVDLVNTRQVDYFDADLEAEWGADWRGRKAALWGLAFKAATDDVREAPALTLARKLARRGVLVAAHDPEAMDNAKRELADAVVCAADPYAALEGADALFVCTEWNSFRSPDFARMRRTMKTPLVFDGRNLYDPGHVAAQGFRLYSVGRPGPDRAAGSPAR